jgi:hypothetical protein
LLVVYLVLSRRLNLLIAIDLQKTKKNTATTHYKNNLLLVCYGLK